MGSLGKAIPTASLLDSAAQDAGAALSQCSVSRAVDVSLTTPYSEPGGLAPNWATRQCDVPPRPRGEA